MADWFQNLSEAVPLARHNEAGNVPSWYGRILDHLPMGVIVCDRSGTVVFANRTAYEITGVTAGQTCRSTDTPCPSGHCRACAPNLAAKGAKGAKVGSPEARGLTHAHVSPDGRVFEVTVVDIATPGQGSNARPSFMTTLRDVTEERELGQRLSRAERLAVTGEISAGVVHAINNPLDGVRRAIELAQRKPNDPERLSSMLALAQEGTDRIANITRTLLSFARDRQEQPVEVEPNILAEDAARLVALTAEAKGVHLRLDLDKTIPSAMLHPEGIREALANLLLNAVDASPPGEEVLLTTRREASTVVMEVSDCGPGVPLEIAPRVFEPFFTTKEIGHGSGLGLAVARRTIEAEGGEVTLVSEHPPGDTKKGAKFRIRVPLRATSGRMLE